MTSSSGTLLDGVPLPSAFALFMVQVVFILGLSRIMTLVLKLIKQPAVVAEMLAGIVLGPTVLGRIPNFSDVMFPAASVSIIQVISSFALIFFMFIVGLELDPAKLKSDLRLSATLSACGITTAFCASCLLTLLFRDPAFSNTDFITLAMFLTCSLGISALPVLARILSERRMLTTRLGSLCMTVAAVDDIIAYTLLALTLALIRSTSRLGILWVVLVTLGELNFMYFVVGPVIRWLVRKDAGHNHLNADTFFYLSLILIGCSYLCEVIGLSALIGAFQTGLLIPRSSNLSHHLSEKLEYITVGILMPLYFTNSGLRTQFGLISDGESVGYTILIIAVATCSKVVGIMVPALIKKVPLRLAGMIGVLMSCKGLIALIVVNYGLDYGVITTKFFSMLVLMVLVTTINTVPLVQLLDPPSRAKETAEMAIRWEADMARRAAERAAKQKRTKGATEVDNMLELPPTEATSVKLTIAGAADEKESAAMGSQTLTPAVKRSASLVDGELDQLGPQASQIKKLSSLKRRLRTKTIGGSELAESAMTTIAETLDSDSAVATIFVPAELTTTSIAAEDELQEEEAAKGPLGLPGVRELTRRFSMRPRTETLGITSREQGRPAAPTSTIGSARAEEGKETSAAMPDHSSIPVATVVPTLNKIVIALGETSVAPSLFITCNMFDEPGTQVTLAWLLDSVDMPSTYMNFTKDISEIRDATLSAALSRSAFRDDMELVTFPTEHPLRDACEEAEKQHAKLILASDYFLRDDSGLFPGREDLGKVLRIALETPKPCTLGLLFEFGPVLAVRSVLCVNDIDSRGLQAAKSMLLQMELSIDITYLHLAQGDPAGQPHSDHRGQERPPSPSHGIQRHRSGRDVATTEGAEVSADRTLGPRQPSFGKVAPDSTPKMGPIGSSRRHIPALPTLVEMPTVNTFANMLAAASDDDLAAYKAAVENARKVRADDSHDNPDGAAADGEQEAASSSNPRSRKSSAASSDRPEPRRIQRASSTAYEEASDELLHPALRIGRPNSREIICRGGANIATALEHVLRSPARSCDLVVVGVDLLDFFMPSSTGEAALENAIKAVKPLLAVCMALRIPALLCVAKTSVPAE